MEEFCIGMDLGGTNIKVALFDQAYHKIAENRVPTEVHAGSDIVLQRMLSGITGLLEQADKKTENIKCIGIGVPGILDMQYGISQFSPNFPKWEDVPIAAWFEERLHIPTYIDHDVRVNLYGEWYAGAARGKDNVVLITLGTGLGAAFIADGHVMYGTSGNAGELGHMNMYRPGRPCHCGSTGCFGRYVSGRGMVRTLQEKLENGADSIITKWCAGDLEKITAAMISQAYDSGDQTAIEAMYDTGRVLGYGLINTINIFNPEIIIIGGGMSGAGERLLHTARETVKEYALKIPGEKCSITTAALNDAAGMLGAAIYADLRFRYQEVRPITKERLMGLV